MSDHYARMVDRVEALVRDPDVDLSARTPACPSWTAWETVCHAAAVVIDGGKGVFPDVVPPTPEWTARQVEEQRERSVDDLFADWRSAMATLGPDTLNSLEIPLLLDGITHEHDVRGAVGRPGAQDDEAIGVLLDMLVRGWHRRLGDLPPLALDDGATVRTTRGDAEPGLVLKGTTFDLLRALTARRSRDQVRAMVVEGDFDRYADHLVLFAWPEGDLP